MLYLEEQCDVESEDGTDRVGGGGECSDARQFLIRLEQGERLARIVIDVCHVLLTQRDLRPVMRRVTSVVRYVCAAGSSYRDVADWDGVDAAIDDGM